MPKYIELKKALQRFEEIKKSRTLLKEAVYLDRVMTVLETIPAADVAPVVHGRWKGWITPAFYGLDDFGDPIYRDAIFYRCSICGRKSAIKEKFCPSCGAMMDLEESR